MSRCRTHLDSAAPTARFCSGASAAPERRHHLWRESRARMTQVAIPDRLLVRPAAVADDALRRLAYSDPGSFPVLFDSAARGPLSRYSILAAYPQAALWQDGGGRLHASGMSTPTGGGFLAALEASLEC